MKHRRLLADRMSLDDLNPAGHQAFNGNRRLVQSSRPAGPYPVELTAEEASALPGSRPFPGDGSAAGKRLGPIGHRQLAERILY